MYQLKLTSRAKGELDKLPARDMERIATCLRELGDNPRPSGVKKLRGSTYRVREGDWRIIYAISDRERLIIGGKIARRSEDTYDRAKDLF